MWVKRARARTRDISLRSSIAVATTTTYRHLFIRRWAFCQSRGGSGPKHHIRRNVASYGGAVPVDPGKRRTPVRDRRGRSGDDSGGGGGGDEARGKPRQEPPPRLSSATSNIRCTSRYQISLIYPHPPSPPPPPRLALKENSSFAHSFPLSTSETKGCVGRVFIRLPLTFSRSLCSVSGFLSSASCSIFYERQRGSKRKGDIRIDVRS